MNPAFLASPSSRAASVLQRALLLCGIALGACTTAVIAAGPATSTTPAPAPAPAATRVFWGDLHVHTRNSFDSFSFGNRGLGPEEAFRFARGEPVRAHNGQTAQLRQPLDFLMVSDHAEFLGVMPRIAEGDKGLLASGFGARWSAHLAAARVADIANEYVGFIQRQETPEGLTPDIEASVWHQLATTAEHFNEPGRFTAFIGYEWSSMINGGNLHRNVLFRDGIARTDRVLPFSALDSPDPEALWAFMARYERDTGGAALAIPHNANLSNGAMFSDRTVGGEPLSASYARERSRWEPVVEVTQMKGDGETHPLLSPADEFADFETWDQTDITMQPKQPWMLGGEYARSALRRGIALQRSLGVNPFSFGMIGSTDSHTALATADDDNFFGKFPDSEPAPARLANKMGGKLWDNRRLAASGYTGVWAPANTREALFDAMRRREVYASSGPRIRLRFFGGWQFAAADLNGADYAERAYRRGVPMGAVLPARGSQQAPSFLVAAARDPQGANLDRVQIVKGWTTPDGSTAERVFDVALSGERAATPPGVRARAVGNTVDLKAATYSNSIGAAELAAAWTDPDFDPAQDAFYYARVLEIPTPRWSTYDAVRFGVERPADVPAETRERAYSSPIWYTPAH